MADARGVWDTEIYVINPASIVPAEPTVSDLAHRTIEGTNFHETFHSPKIGGLEKPEKAQTPYSDKRCLNSVFSSTARSVGQQIKYTHLAEGFTIPTIKKAFDPNFPSGYVFSSAPYSELLKQS